MLFTPPANPLRYTPDVEEPEKGEDATGESLNDTMQSIRETTLKDGGHAIRSVHAKSHGILQGEMDVLDQEYAALAQGLFGKPGRYPVVMRYSTIPGDLLDDEVSTPRGLGIKVYGVEGEQLPGASGTTQDFVLVNGPAFSAPNAKAFLANLKLLASTTNKMEGTKKVLSAALRPVEKVLEAAGHKSPNLITLGGHPETNILGETYYTQTPILYGDYIAKLSVAPVSPELKALTDAPLDLKDNPDGIREAVLEHFRTHGGEWEVRVQLCTDLHHMPVENAAKVWPEDESPYIPVARIRVEPQTAWSEARSTAVDDGLSFSPWHGLAAHRPLGSINRLRKAAYEMSARFRAENNHTAVGEPRSFAPLPD